MKRFIKRIIEVICCFFLAKKSKKDIYKEIDKYNYISFDMFDTLIKRNIKNPSDIFDYVQIEYNRSHNSINNFKENRIKAEKVARIESKNDEIELQEIYSKLEKYYSKSELSELMKLEIEIEINFCTKSNLFYKIYDYCLKNHKRIFITSDMYLPKEVIIKILKNNQYFNYEKLYLSSDYMMTKHSGKLFDVLLKEQEINKSDIIHIGDSFYSDYLMPKRQGIKALLIKRNINNSTFCSKSKCFEYNILESFISNNIEEEDNKYNKFGYEVLGPILYSFTTWINKTTTNDGIEKLYFLARDAHIIMDAYNLRFKNNNTKYINVSRRSMLMPGLDSIESFDNLLDAYKSILKKTSKVEDAFNVLEIDYKSFFNDEKLSKKLIMDLTKEEKTIIFNSIKDELYDKSKQQKLLLQKYLSQNDMNGNIGLIDVGWNGTIQFYLDKILEKKSTGYYYGVNKDSKYSDYLINRKGCLFQNDILSEDQAIIYLNSGLFELMFLALEGTTLSYKMENGNVKAELAKTKYPNDMVDIINNIQGGAISFVRDVENSNMREYMNNISNTVYFENFRNLTKHPSKELIKMFENVYFENFDNRKLISNKPLLYYLVSPKRFYSDFMNSYCKTIFLRRVLKLNLPYYKLLIKMYYKGKK